MKKIGIIITDITLRNGTERAVSNLANILSAKYDVFIFSVGTETGSPAYPLSSPVKVVHKKIFSCSKESLWGRLSSKLDFIKFINSLDFDIFISSAPIYSFLLSLSGASKTIGCEHFNYEAVPFRTKLLRCLFYPFLDAVVLLTQDAWKKFSFIKERKRHVIPNNSPYPVCGDFYSAESKILLAVGRLTYQKGFDMLIDAAKIVFKRKKDWKLIIVGDGEDKGLLLSQICENQLEEFISILPPTQDITKYYKIAGLYVLPSRFEGFGLVLIEAQSFGIPCVSFDCCSGPSEIIDDNSTGYLVTPNDVEKLAEKLLLLMDNKEKRKVFSQNALEKAKTFSLEAIAVKWFELLEKI